jgi:hypothetical protein
VHPDRPDPGIEWFNPMPKREKKTSRKRSRRRHWLDEETSESLPAYIPIDLEQLPKETADATKKWAERAAAIAASPPSRAFIDRPFGQPAPSKPKPKRKGKRGRGRDWDYSGIERLAEDYIRTYGLPRTASLLIEKVDDACKVASVLFDATKTQCKQIVRSIFRREKSRKLKLISDQDHKKRPPIRKK